MKRNSNSPTFYFLVTLLFIFQITNAQNIAEERQEMLLLVNDLRTSRNLEPLRLVTELNNAAQQHSDDMATNDFFDHTGSDNSTFDARIRDNQYQGVPTGENIAAGSSDVEATFNLWKNSDGHLRNMLASSTNEIGIGYASNTSSQYRNYWTQVFGIGDNVLSNDSFAANKIRTATVFPNPAINEITVALQKVTTTPIAFRLTDSTGKLLKTITLKSNQKNLKIVLSDLPSGLYFLTANRFESFKIVKI